MVSRAVQSRLRELTVAPKENSRIVARWTSLRLLLDVPVHFTSGGLNEVRLWECAEEKQCKGELFYSTLSL